MAKLKLNPDPTFQRKIKVPTAAGGTADLTLTYKYRTREEMQEFSNWLAGLKPPEFPAVRELKEDEQYSDEERSAIAGHMTEYARKVCDWDTDIIMEFVVGWDLDEPFTRDNVRELVNKHNKQIRKIVLDDYSVALTPAALGN
jgi:hypothetical protein